MRQRHQVINAVGVANRGDRHGLGHIPIQRRERQRLRVHRHVTAAVPADRHRHIPNRRSTQFHGVSAANDAVVGHDQVQRRRRQRDRGVVVDHRHRHRHRRRVVAAAGRGVRQRHHLINGVGVASRGDRHGLGHIPVRGGERQRLRVHRHVAAEKPRNRHRHIPARLIPQLHAVSAGSALINAQRRRRHHDRRVGGEVGHPHRHMRGRVVAAAGRGVCQRHPVINAVAVSNRGDRHDLRHIPI